MTKKWKNELLKNGFLKSKNLLKGKKIVILSCGPSIEKYKNIIDFNNIIVAIKTATDYSNKKEDFFFYDERMFNIPRKNFNYKLNNKSIKVFCKNSIKNENKTFNFPFDFDIQFCISNNCLPFNLWEEDFKFEQSEEKNKIYYNCNLFFPIILKILMFFSYLGVTKFDLFGVNWYNKDVTPQVKHFMIKDFIKNKKKPQKIGFDNLLGSYYSNIFLQDIIDKYKLEIKLYSEYSQININIPRVNLKNEIFFQKSNFYIECRNNIINNKDKNKNYYLISSLCNKSIYYNKLWYKILILMVSLMDNYNYENINKKWIDNIDNHKNRYIFGDYLYSLGCAIGM